MTDILMKWTPFVLVPLFFFCAGRPVEAEEGGLKEITPKEAFQFLSENEDAVLVDVRSRAEYHFVGHPVVAYNIPLMFWNARTYRFEPNPRFAEDLTAKIDKNRPLLLICRSGGRSAAAGQKALSLGFKEVYNVIEGVEGTTDDEGRRTVNGWKNAGLPYAFEVKEELRYKEAD